MSSRSEPRHDAVLREWGLTIDGPLSDDLGDTFETLRAHDSRGRVVVVKRVARETREAYRRFTNESRLLTALAHRQAPRLLTPRASTPGLLVTEFDAGTQLRQETMDGQGVVPAVAEALTAFQRVEVDPPSLGIVDRERLEVYYVKVLAKSLVHVWPAVVGTMDAARAVVALGRAMPAIRSARVICHGDFIPTNLLYDASRGGVTITDLEGFITANHPLFDVLALCTTGREPLHDWHWQRRFIRRYLERAQGLPGVDVVSRRFREAYRGILVFFLAWRLSERYLALDGRAYFDGLAQRAYARRRIGALLRASGWRADESARRTLAVDVANLRDALDAARFRQHFDRVCAASD